MNSYSLRHYHLRNFASGCRWFIGLLCSALVVACGSRTELLSGAAAGGNTASGNAGSGGGSIATGGSTPQSSTILFELRFISDVPESIYVNQTDSAWLNNGHWLTLRRNGKIIRKADACEICSCSQCPNCPVCGAPCQAVTEITNGGKTEWLWSGKEYPSEPCPSAPETSCLNEVIAPAGSYTAEFCWGLTFEGTPPCAVYVSQEYCAEVSFQIPEPDGLVDYLVNNSG